MWGNIRNKLSKLVRIIENKIREHHSMIDSRAFICSNRFSGTYANSVRKIIIVWFLFSHRKSVFVFSRSFYLLLNEKVFLIQYKCCTETWFLRCSSQEFSVIQLRLWICWHYQTKSFNFSHDVTLIKPRPHRSSGVFLYVRISLHSCNYLFFSLTF